MSIHPNPAFLHPLLRRDQMEETHVPLLSKIFWAETGKVLAASAANLPDRLRSDPNSVTYNQLALRFLLFRVFSFLRCTRLILSSFEVLQWVPLWWPGSQRCFVLIFYSWLPPVHLQSPLNIRVSQWQRRGDWALPLHDKDTEGTGTCWPKGFCSWEWEMWFCSKDGLSKGNTSEGWLL